MSNLWPRLRVGLLRASAPGALPALLAVALVLLQTLAGCSGGGGNADMSLAPPATVPGDSTGPTTNPGTPQPPAGEPATTPSTTPPATPSLPITLQDRQPGPLLGKPNTGQWQGAGTGSGGLWEAAAVSADGALLQLGVVFPDDATPEGQVRWSVLRAAPGLEAPAGDLRLRPRSDGTGGYEVVDGTTALAVGLLVSASGQISGALPLRVRGETRPSLFQAVRLRDAQIDPGSLADFAGVYGLVSLQSDAATGADPAVGWGVLQIGAEGGARYCADTWQWARDCAQGVDLQVAFDDPAQRHLLRITQAPATDQNKAGDFASRVEGFAVARRWGTEGVSLSIQLRATPAGATAARASASYGARLPLAAPDPSGLRGAWNFAVRERASSQGGLVRPVLFGVDTVRGRVRSRAALDGVCSPESVNVQSHPEAPGVLVFQADGAPAYALPLDEDSLAVAVPATGQLGIARRYALDPAQAPCAPTPQVPPLANRAGPGRLVDAALIRTLTTAELQALQASGGSAALSVPPRYAVDAYRLHYSTVDGAGREVVASALAAVPRKRPGTPSPVLSYHHGTVTRDAESPSQLGDPAVRELTLASQGFLVLAADYVGYGVSRGTLHPYLLADPSAAAVTDLLAAARYWRQTRQLVDNQQLFLAGYSEGGYVSLAVQRALESAGAGDGTVLEGVYAGAGPYDVALTLDGGLALIRRKYPVLGLLLSPGLLKLLSDADRNNVRDALLEQLLGKDADVQFQPTIIDDYLADNRAALDTRSSVFDWKPLRVPELYHGSDDQTVPYANATKVQIVMREKGVTVPVAACTAQPATHLDCVPGFWQWVWSRLQAVARDL